MREYTDEDREQIDRWSQQIGIEIKRENWEAAHTIVDRARAELEAANLETLGEVPLTECGLDLRVVNMLDKNFSAATLADIPDIAIGALLGVNMVGTTTVFSLLQQLLRFAIKRDGSLQTELARLRGVAVRGKGRRPAQEPRGDIQRKRHRQASEAFGEED